MFLTEKEHGILVNDGGNDQDKVYAALCCLGRALEASRDTNLGTRFGLDKDRWIIRCELVAADDSRREAA